MALSVEFVEYVREQLTALGGVESRRMFGGVGLYCHGVFFALIAADVLYFKVDDGNRADYESRGMRAFRPFAAKPRLSVGYYEVPADVLEEPEECALWARRSVAAAGAAAARRRGPAAGQPGPAATRRRPTATR